MARPKAQPTTPPADDAEAIALRIHQLAATAGVLAVGAGRVQDDGRSMAHALFLLEECLLDVERRVERLRAFRG